MLTMAVLCRAMKGDEAITSFFPVGTVRTSGVERAREKMHVGSPPLECAIIRFHSIFHHPPPTSCPMALSTLTPFNLFTQRFELTGISA
jgi:hypothetical protein